MTEKDMEMVKGGLEADEGERGRKYDGCIYQLTHEGERVRGGERTGEEERRDKIWRQGRLMEEASDRGETG